MTRITSFRWLTNDAIELSLDDDGRARTEVLDDIESVRHWGNAFVFRFKTRDPVIVRADRSVHMLTSAA